MLIECKAVHPKGNQPWKFTARTDAEAEALIIWLPDMKNQLIWKDPDAGKDRGEGGNRRWTGWMTSSTQWTWVWANSGRQWRTGKPGVLQSMGSQRVGHNWATEQQQLSARCSEDQLRWYNGKSGFQTSLGLIPNSPICNLCCCSYCCC